MKIRLIIISIIIMIIVSPIYNSSLINNNNIDNNKINLAIYHSKEDGDNIFTIKQLDINKYESIIYEITKEISQSNTVNKPFNNVLNILKENNLIDEDISLKDILGDKVNIINNTIEFNVSFMEPFVSLYAPIIIAGMGFGGGIGDRFGIITGLLHSGGIIGLGGVFCFDLLAQTIYVQYTFTFPLLLHILASFIGIMMFPVNFDFISENYLPLYIYSNFIGIGYSAVAIGVPLGY